VPDTPEEWRGSLILGQQDKSGLTYMRNRYYDASTGRFTQVDPIGVAGGLNVYGFASGDPVNFSDPQGFSCQRLSNERMQCENIGAGDASAIGSFLGLEGPPTAISNWDRLSTHVIPKHLEGTEPGGTLFRSMSNEELKGVISRTVAEGLPEQQGSRWVFYMLWKKAIGRDAGLVVSRVVVEGSGTLVTAYPVALSAAPEAVATMAAAGERWLLGAIIGRLGGRFGFGLAVFIMLITSPTAAY
jgi:RHS repeat-associated protein